MDTLSLIKETKILPVVVFNSIEEVNVKLSALLEGGINAAEICFRTECSPDALKLAIKNFSNMLIGAGTIINRNQCKLAIELGAKFIVSPGFSEEVNKECLKNNILYIPGAVTPTEIMNLLSKGINYIKFFPAGSFGGLKAIKDLASAFPNVHFMPTGGVNNDNLIEFITFKNIFAVGGSWLLKGDIVKNCQEAKKIVERGK